MAHDTRLVFIRHGEARAAIDHVVAGHRGCRGLTPTGIRQAELLRDRLAASDELQVDVLISSVLPRAVETARIIAPAAAADLAAQDCEFCELHPGECDGLSYAEYEQRYAFDMLAEPERPMSPGGESLAMFQQRVAARVHRLAREHAGQTVMIVCHGGVIRAATLTLLAAPGVHEPKPFRLDPANTSITEWVLQHAALRSPRWLLARFNDSAHLSIRSPAATGP